MTQWQYRLRYTNYDWGDGGPGAGWQDVRPGGRAQLTVYSDLEFRPRPRRSLVAAVLRRAGNKQQRREARDA